MNQVIANKTSEPDDNNVSAPAPVPVFQIGTEVGGVLESAPAKDQAEPHQSILDIDIPDAALLEVTEAPDLMRQESFLTEVEEFNNTEEETKEVSTELETELRPVFELCQPNSAGLISIEHLRAMCREHGQVITALNFQKPKQKGRMSLLCGVGWNF